MALAVHISGNKIGDAFGLWHGTGLPESIELIRRNIEMIYDG